MFALKHKTLLNHENTKLPAFTVLAHPRWGFVFNLQEVGLPNLPTTNSTLNNQLSYSVLQTKLQQPVRGHNGLCAYWYCVNRRWSRARDASEAVVNAESVQPQELVA